MEQLAPPPWVVGASRVQHAASPWLEGLLALDVVAGGCAEAGGSLRRRRAGGRPVARWRHRPACTSNAAAVNGKGRVRTTLTDMHTAHGCMQKDVAQQRYTLSEV